MLAEIQEAIRKHLPGEVGEQMKKFIEEAQEKDKSIQELKTILKKDRDQITEIMGREAKLLKEKETWQDLSKMKQDLDERQKNLEITILRAQLESEQKFSGKVTDFMINMSKNTVYRKKFSGGIPAGVTGPDQYGNPGTAIDSFVNQTTEIAEDTDEHSPF